MDTTWMAEGKCKDLHPSIFFPSDGVGVEVARRICADCPVKEPCLEYALENRIDHGVWGGASERERRRIARRRRLEAAKAQGELHVRSWTWVSAHRNRGEPMRCRRDARDDDVLECVINVSCSGRAALVPLVDAADGLLLDVHDDPGHDRSVLTLM
jgi:WhiB family redox-sensing transcriptional regulator